MREELGIDLAQDVDKAAKSFRPQLCQPKLPGAISATRNGETDYLSPSGFSGSKKRLGLRRLFRELGTCSRQRWFRPTSVETTGSYMRFCGTLPVNSGPDFFNKPAGGRVDMATVLCTGADRVLIETRALILRGAGHSVVTVMGEPELIAACQQNRFQVAVIGQAISNIRKQHVYHLVRQHCPSAKILELYSPEHGKTLPDADDWLEVPAQVPSDLAVHVQRLAVK